MTSSWSRSRLVRLLLYYKLKLHPFNSPVFDVTIINVAIDRNDAAGRKINGLGIEL